MIIGIVAISRNYAIGRKGKLPWHYSADLKFFRETTTGNAVVMGANTWRSIGKPLPERLNIVMSVSGNVDTPPKVMRLSGVLEVVELAKHLNCDIFVIGGASIYRAFAGSIDEWIVTNVPIDVPDADTFMPVDFLDGFETSETIALEDGLVVKKLHRTSI